MLAWKVNRVDSDMRILSPEQHFEQFAERQENGTYNSCDPGDLSRGRVCRVRILVRRHRFGADGRRRLAGPFHANALLKNVPAGRKRTHFRKRNPLQQGQECGEWVRFAHFFFLPTSRRLGERTDRQSRTPHALAGGCGTSRSHGPAEHGGQSLSPGFVER